MRFLKALLFCAFCSALVACGGGSAAPERGASCVLETKGYAVRVKRGEARFEFVSPDAAAGMTVSFGEDGVCAIGAPGGGASDGVCVPVADAAGYRDWLVLAYPEDYAPDGVLAPDGSGQFELDGAAFSFESDGSCRVARRGLERRAIRTDE